MMMVITSLIVSPLSRWRCFLPSLNRGCWAFNSGKVPWQNSSQSTKSCTMSISDLLFVVGISGANLSRFLPKKESRDSTTELISLRCFNFYIELTLNQQFSIRKSFDLQPIERSHMSVQGFHGIENENIEEIAQRRPEFGFGP